MADCVVSDPCTSGHPWIPPFDVSSSPRLYIRTGLVFICKQCVFPIVFSKRDPHLEIYMETQIFL